MNKLSIAKACRFLGISRQAYYQHHTRCLKRAEYEARVVQFVRSERMLQPRIGTRKLQYLMKAHSMNIGRDRLFCLLRHNRLLVAPKRAYHKTTNSHHRFRRHPNLIKEVTRPE